MALFSLFALLDTEDSYKTLCRLIVRRLFQALYDGKQREPEQGVNFVTCHDGFTLRAGRGGAGDTALGSLHDIVPWRTAPELPVQTYRVEARSSVVLFAATRSRKPLAAVAPSDCDRRCSPPRGWAATVIPGPVRMGHRDSP